MSQYRSCNMHINFDMHCHYCCDANGLVRGMLGYSTLHFDPGTQDMVTITGACNMAMAVGDTVTLSVPRKYMSDTKKKLLLLELI